MSAEVNTPSKVTIVWFEALNVKLIFLGTFEVSYKMISCCFQADFQKIHLFQAVSREDAFM